MYKNNFFLGLHSFAVREKFQQNKMEKLSIQEMYTNNTDFRSATSLFSLVRRMSFSAQENFQVAIYYN